MSDCVQYEQLAVKLKGSITAMLFVAEPNSYVMFEGVALFRIEIGSTSFKQVLILQGS